MIRYLLSCVKGVFGIFFQIVGVGILIGLIIGMMLVMIFGAFI